MSGRRFVVLDRDGTVLVYRPYLSDPAQAELIPGAAEGLRALRDAGLGLVVVTNQSAVARGWATPDDVARVNARMEALLSEEGVTLDAVRVCLHGPGDGCACRKPRTGLVEALSRELGFEARECVVVGDNASDIALGRALGCPSVLVRTGLGDEMLAEGEVACDHVADDLQGAARWILALVGRGEETTRGL